MTSFRLISRLAYIENALNSLHAAQINLNAEESDAQARLQSLLAHWDDQWKNWNHVQRLLALVEARLLIPRVRVHIAKSNRF